MFNIFEKLNERFGCNTPGSQLYFSKIEVIETKYESGRPLWRVFGYTYHDSYIECGWLDLPSEYAGLIPGMYERQM